MSETRRPRSQWRTLAGVALVGAVALTLVWVLSATPTAVEPAPGAGVTEAPPAASTPLEPTAALSPPAALQPKPAGPPQPARPPTYKATEVKEALDDNGEPPDRFVERTYDPPYELPYYESMPDPASLETPEEALGSLTSAMSKVDWDWWIQLWDRPSRAELARVLRMQGVDKSRFIEVWEVVARGQRFVATRRIDMEGYVILYSRREGASEDEIEAKSPLAMKRDADGRWWFTHELRDHPVFTYDLEGARDGVEVRTVQ